MPLSTYRVTAPNGKVYIGVSKNVPVRWCSHKRKARNTPNKRHPFYDAIRAFGPSRFEVVVLSSHGSEEEALQAEIDTITEYRATDRAYGYNISPGGGYDCLVGPLIFWERMYSDPKAFEEYRAKMRVAQAKIEHPYPQHLVDAYASLPARERWKRVHRAQRMSSEARRTKGRPRPAGCLTPEYAANMAEAVRRAWEATPPSHKKKWAMLRRKSALAQWARRTDAERADVAFKISTSQKATFAADPSRKRQNEKQLATARNSIDRSAQGPAASKGLRAYWADLKSRPADYAAFLATRAATRRRTMGARK